MKHRSVGLRNQFNEQFELLGCAVRFVALLASLIWRYAQRLAGFLTSRSCCTAKRKALERTSRILSRDSSRAVDLLCSYIPAGYSSKILVQTDPTGETTGLPAIIDNT